VGEEVKNLKAAL